MDDELKIIKEVEKSLDGTYGSLWRSAIDIQETAIHATFLTNVLSRMTKITEPNDTSEKLKRLKKILENIEKESGILKKEFEELIIKHNTQNKGE